MIRVQSTASKTFQIDCHLLRGWVCRIKPISKPINRNEGGSQRLKGTLSSLLLTPLVKMMPKLQRSRLKTNAKTHEEE